MSPTRTRSPRGPRAFRPPTGFTLTEVLLAATIGAVLMTALAASVGTFAETVAYLDEESVADTDAALARISADVRYAWRVDVPSRSRLQVVDGNGGVTEYYGASGDLRVTLPTGEDGVLLEGITGLTFESDTVRRLREGTIQTFSGVLHRQLPNFAMPPDGFVLEPGEELALSFEVDSDAGRGTVTDVTEQIVGFTPSVVQLQVAAAGPGATLSLDLQPSRAPADSRPRSTASSLNTVQAVSGARLPSARTRAVALDGSTTYYAPTTVVPLSVSGMPSELEPGVAYTVLVRAGGTDSTILQSRADSSRSSVQKQSGGSWSAQSAIVGLQVTGTYRTTGTTEHQEVSMVRTAITTDAGVQRVGSAAVYSQALAEDPWLGVVAGDSPPGS